MVISSSLARWRQYAIIHTCAKCATTGRRHLGTISTFATHPAGGGPEIVQNSLQSCWDPHRKVSALICAETEGYVCRHVRIKQNLFKILKCHSRGRAVNYIKVWWWRQTDAFLCVWYLVWTVSDFKMITRWFLEPFFVCFLDSQWLCWGGLWFLAHALS